MNDLYLLQLQWRKDIDIKLLVDCTHLSEDGVTLNHVYSLISSVAKLIPEKIVEHMLDILTLIGKSAIRQVITDKPVFLKLCLFI